MRRDEREKSAPPQPGSVAGGSKSDGKMSAQEAKAFQELERGFRRMEERVEALETIIIDRSRKDSIQREYHR